MKVNYFFLSIIILFTLMCEPIQAKMKLLLPSSSSIYIPLFTTSEEGGINDYKTNAFDMSTYINPNDTYIPSEEVEQSTSISSGDFENSELYVMKGAAVPIALFCIGLVALFSLNCCLCFGAARMCTSRKTEYSHTLSCGEFCTNLIFIIFFIICFIAAHVLYTGYGEVGDGFDIMRTSANTIELGFDEMNGLTLTLLQHAQNLKVLCFGYGCYELALDVDGGASYMYDDLERIPSDVHEVGVAIDDAESLVNALTFVMYCCLMFTLATYVLTEFCCKANPFGAICCGNITFIIIAFIGVLWMIITSVTADYCYENPTINTLNAMSASKDQMYLIWYSSCYSGENPIHRYVNYTNVANEEIIVMMENDNSTRADQIRVQTTQVTSLLGDITDASWASCSPVQSGWLSLVNDGVCDSFFLGVRTIWICEMVACITLFILMITGAIIGMSAKDSQEAVHPGDSRAGHYRASGGEDDLEFLDETPRENDQKVEMPQLGEDHTADQEQPKFSLDFEH